MKNILDSLTLRLVRLFEATYRLGSVSQAAEEIGISQSSVSLGLNRLRQYFDDPLFVRVGARMTPTPRADQLIEPVRTILHVASSAFFSEENFTPETSSRLFTLHMTDLGETIIIPKLINHLLDHAPAIRLRIRAISEDSQKLLSNGTVDLVLGYLDHEAETLVQRKLFDEHLVGVVRHGHPRIVRHATAEDLVRERQVKVSIAGTGHANIRYPGVGEEEILDLPGFLAVGAVIARSDLVGFVPSRLAAQLQEYYNLQTFALPGGTERFQVRQYWHPRFHNDPGHQWLRAEIVRLFATG